MKAVSFIQVVSAMSSVEDEKKIPAWLRADYIENILRNHFNDEQLKVTNLINHAYGGGGDNYVAAMSRVDVEFVIGTDERSLSLIIKTMPQNEFAIKCLGPTSYNMQHKEMEFYEKIAPEFTKILKAVGVETILFPDVYGVDRTHDVLYIEDLSKKNFVMRDRHVGLDLDHLKLILDKLAAFHAASVVLGEKNKEAYKLFYLGMFNRQLDVINHLVYDHLAVLTDEVASWDGWEYYAKKLGKMSGSFFESVNRTSDCDDGDFHVLTHGDLWCNNMLFQNDSDGKLVDACLIDFQILCVGSPAIDLLVSSLEIN